MAKDKRFPSDANKPKKPKAVDDSLKVEVYPSVQGKSQKLVQVEYMKDNHHLLDHVTAIRKGVNHIPEDVWQKAKSHPATMAMIKMGHLKDLSELPMGEEEPVAGSDEGAEQPAEAEIQE